MHRKPFLDLLAAYAAQAPEAEQPLLAELAGFVKTTPNCFERHHEAGAKHLCASVLLVRDDLSQALLGKHKKTGFWIQAGGGHMDGDTDPAKVALKELMEETGITTAHLPQALPLDIFAIHYGPATFGYEKTIYDVRFLATVPHGIEPSIFDEFHELRWVTPEEGLALARADKNAGTRQLVEKWQAYLQTR